MDGNLKLSYINRCPFSPPPADCFRARPERFCNTRRRRDIVYLFRGLQKIENEALGQSAGGGPDGH
jgi:hypothetical protein